MMELTKEFMQDIIKGSGFGVAPSAVEEMARQLLASMEQEPVGFIHPFTPFTFGRGSGSIFQQETRHYYKPVYAAPQFTNSDSEPTSLSNTGYPQPVVVDDVVGKLIGILDMHTIELGWGEKPITLAELVIARDGGDELNACRAAMLQGKPKNVNPIDDTQRMDWLVSHVVEVREPMLYGSHALFHAQELSDETDEEYRNDLREKIDKVMNNDK